MSPFAFLLLCIQACLVQPPNSDTDPDLVLATKLDLDLATDSAGPAAIAGPAYGGTGVGDIAVAGEMGVAGTTLVAGQVPILGAVRFGGEVPAGGVVSIAGNCAGGCGCNGAYNGGYLY
ncbi:Chorion class A protein Ld19 [Papilio xuthus]|uniref:Chorion class A protein Ld19 n=1 Tax=Papilio xuthus TaxID=66420 RepID=A0A194PZB5_PAPXU|nr:Chorion class A protein Ld19 [Papilio xuthus]